MLIIVGGILVVLLLVFIIIHYTRSTQPPSTSSSSGTSSSSSLEIIHKLDGESQKALDFTGKNLNEPFSNSVKRPVEAQNRILPQSVLDKVIPDDLNQGTGEENKMYQYLNLITKNIHEQTQNGIKITINDNNEININSGDASIDNLIETLGYLYDYIELNENWIDTGSVIMSNINIKKDLNISLDEISIIPNLLERLILIILFIQFYFPLSDNVHLESFFSYKNKRETIENIVADHMDILIYYQQEPENEEYFNKVFRFILGFFMLNSYFEDENNPSFKMVFPITFTESHFKIRTLNCDEGNGFNYQEYPPPSKNKLVQWFGDDADICTDIPIAKFVDTYVMILLLQFTSEPTTQNDPSNSSQ